VSPNVVHQLSLEYDEKMEIIQQCVKGDEMIEGVKLISMMKKKSIRGYL
jgi:hypothetical protein